MLMFHQSAADVISHINSFSSIENTMQFIDEMAQQFDFDYYTYSRVFKRSITQTGLITVGNYPRAWLDRYMEQQYVNIDPVMKHCCNSTLPYEWSNMYRQANPEQLNFIKECNEFGLKQGVTMATSNNLGHFSSISFGGAQDRLKKTATKNEILTTMHLILPYLQEKLVLLDNESDTKGVYGNSEEKYRLSNRERECLLWTAEGKTADEISMILSISTSTVNFHLKNAVKQLDCSNKTHAAAKAVLLGLL